jgi:3-oxo-5-alpha-steroid 4-dehydrogenase 1
MWAAGAAVNLQADYHLIALRAAKGEGYHIPTAGLFEFVSGANFLGEIIEWTGYAIACNHLGAYAFAWFTCCNLVPSALRNHADNQTRFGPRYPPIDALSFHTCCKLF